MGFYPIYQDNTAASGVTVPNTDTNLKSFTLPENNYKTIFVLASVKTASTGTSTAQNLTFKIKIGTTIAANTKNFVRPITAAVVTYFDTFYHFGECRAKEVVAVSHGAPAADANTTVTCQDLNIIGIT
ncbi:MAG: hypothetical protein DA328_07995 [Nitrososphaeraceae archaeon]|nr:hypothetical protein [Nitrososphaeraceae archaeon]